jgi:hypothetical protein
MPPQKNKVHFPEVLKSMRKKESNSAGSGKIDIRKQLNQ